MAHHYYLLSAELNNPTALANLGHLYFNGENDDQNYEKSRRTI